MFQCFNCSQATVPLPSIQWVDVALGSKSHFILNWKKIVNQAVREAPPSSRHNGDRQRILWSATPSRTAVRLIWYRNSPWISFREIWSFYRIRFRLRKFNFDKEATCLLFFVKSTRTKCDRVFIIYIIKYSAYNWTCSWYQTEWIILTKKIIQKPVLFPRIISIYITAFRCILEYGSS